MTNYNRLLILITFLFIDLSIGFAQKTWKSDKYAYTVEIPSGYLIRKPTGKNIDLSLQSEDHAIASNTLNPQLHSRSATYIKRNGLLIRKITIKSSRPFQCAYHPLTP